jgi:hypothetical protein
MQVEGNYAEDGYALVRGLLPSEICTAFLNRMKEDLDAAGTPIESMKRTGPLLLNENVELYGFHYSPMLALLWGLTPTMSGLAGRTLLPTYDYFRIYREGDICRVHSDRPSCEYSLSLTLDYSDGVPWDLEISSERIAEPNSHVAPDFEGSPFAALQMEPGDAVLYEGVYHRHGRVTPNPNQWSAHLFMHWVDSAGPYADRAFDGNAALTQPANFTLR